MLSPVDPPSAAPLEPVPASSDNSGVSGSDGGAADSVGSDFVVAGSPAPVAGMTRVTILILVRWPRTCFRKSPFRLNVSLSPACAVTAPASSLGML